MGTLAVVLLLIVSASCEFRNWTEEQSAIQSSLTSKALEEKCEGILSHYCVQAGRNSFILQWLSEQTYNRLWLDKIGHILRVVENIQKGTEIKETYVSLITDTFIVLQDLLKEYATLDNQSSEFQGQIVEIEKINAPEDGSTTAPEDTFTTSLPVATVESQLIDIVKDLMALLHQRFQASEKISNLNDTASKLNDALQRNNESFDVYQPLLQKLESLIQEVLTTPNRTLSLPILTEKVNDTIDELTHLSLDTVSRLWSPDFKEKFLNQITELQEIFNNIVGTTTSSTSTFKTTKSPSSATEVTQVIFETATLEKFINICKQIFKKFDELEVTSDKELKQILTDIKKLQKEIDITSQEDYLMNKDQTLVRIVKFLDEVHFIDKEILKKKDIIVNSDDFLTIKDNFARLLHKFETYKLSDLQVIDFFESVGKILLENKELIQNVEKTEKISTQPTEISTAIRETTTTPDSQLILTTVEPASLETYFKDFKNLFSDFFTKINELVTSTKELKPYLTEIQKLKTDITADQDSESNDLDSMLQFLDKLFPLVNDIVLKGDPLIGSVSFQDIKDKFAVIFSKLEQHDIEYNPLHNLFQNLTDTLDEIKDILEAALSNNSYTTESSVTESQEEQTTTKKKKTTTLNNLVSTEKNPTDSVKYFEELKNLFSDFFTKINEPITTTEELKPYLSEFEKLKTDITSDQDSDNNDLDSMLQFLDKLFPLVNDIVIKGDPLIGSVNFQNIQDKFAVIFSKLDQHDIEQVPINNLFQNLTETLDEIKEILEEALSNISFTTISSVTESQGELTTTKKKKTTTVDKVVSTEKNPTDAVKYFEELKNLFSDFFTKINEPVTSTTELNPYLSEFEKLKTDITADQDKVNNNDLDSMLQFLDKLLPLVNDIVIKGDPLIGSVSFQNIQDKFAVIFSKLDQHDNEHVPIHILFQNLTEILDEIREILEEALRNNSVTTISSVTESQEEQTTTKKKKTTTVDKVVSTEKNPTDSVKYFEELKNLFSDFFTNINELETSTKGLKQYLSDIQKLKSDITADQDNVRTNDLDSMLQFLDKLFPLVNDIVVKGDPLIGSESFQNINDKFAVISSKLDQYDVEHNPIHILFQNLTETLDEIKEILEQALSNISFTTISSVTESQGEQTTTKKKKTTTVNKVVSTEKNPTDLVEYFEELKNVFNDFFTKINDLVTSTQELKPYLSDFQKLKTDITTYQDNVRPNDLDSILQFLNKLFPLVNDIVLKADPLIGSVTFQNIKDKFAVIFSKLDQHDIEHNPIHNLFQNLTETLDEIKEILEDALSNISFTTISSVTESQGEQTTTKKKKTTTVKKVVSTEKNPTHSVKYFEDLKNLFSDFFTRINELVTSTKELKPHLSDIQEFIAAITADQDNVRTDDQESMLQFLNKLLPLVNDIVLKGDPLIGTVSFQNIQDKFAVIFSKLDQHDIELNPTHILFQNLTKTLDEIKEILEDALSSNSYTTISSVTESQGEQTTTRKKKTTTVKKVVSTEKNPTDLVEYFEELKNLYVETVRKIKDPSTTIEDLKQNSHDILKLLQEIESKKDYVEQNDLKSIVQFLEDLNFVVNEIIIKDDSLINSDVFQTIIEDFDTILEKLEVEDKDHVEILDSLKSSLEILDQVKEIINKTEGTNINLTTQHSMTTTSERVQIPSTIETTFEKNYFEEFKKLYYEIVQYLDNHEYQKLQISNIEALEQAIKSQPVYEKSDVLKFIAKMLDDLSTIIKGVLSKWDIMLESYDFKVIKIKLTTLQNDLVDDNEQAVEKHVIFTKVYQTLDETKNIINKVVTEVTLTTQRIITTTLKNEGTTADEKKYFEEFLQLFKYIVKEIDQAETQSETLKVYLTDIRRLQDEIVIHRDVRKSEDMMSILKLLAALYSIVTDIIENWTKLIDSKVIQDMRDNLTISVYHLKNVDYPSENSQIALETLQKLLDEIKNVLKNVQETENEPITPPVTTKDPFYTVIDLFKEFYSVIKEQENNPDTIKEIYSKIANFNKDIKSEEHFETSEHLKSIVEFLDDVLVITRGIEELLGTQQYDLVRQVLLEKSKLILEGLTTQQFTDDHIPIILEEARKILNEISDIVDSSRTTTIASVTKSFYETSVDETLVIITNLVNVLENGLTNHDDFNAVIEKIHTLDIAINQEQGSDSELQTLSDILNIFLNGLTAVSVNWEKLHNAPDIDDFQNELLKSYQQIQQEFKKGDRSTLIGRVMPLVKKIDSYIAEYIKNIKNIEESNETIGQEIVDSEIRKEIIVQIINVIYKISLGVKESKKVLQKDTFSLLLKKIKEIKEDLTDKGGNEDFVKYYREILDYLSFIVNDIVTKWKTINKNSNFDDAVRKIIQQLEEMKRKFQEISEVKLSQQEIEPLKHIKDTIVKILRNTLTTEDHHIEEPAIVQTTRNQIVTIIQALNDIVVNRASKVHEFTSLIDALRGVIAKTESFEQKEIRTEYLNLINNLIKIIDIIKQQWNSISQVSNFDEFIDLINNYFKEINDLIVNSATIQNTGTQLDESLAQSVGRLQEILEKITPQPTSTVSIENGHESTIQMIKKVDTIIKSFSTFLEKKPSHVKDFIKLLNQLIFIKKDFDPVGSEDDVVKNYALFQTNVIDIFQDIINKWSNVYRFRNRDAIVKKLVNELEDLRNVLKESEKDYHILININELFSERREKIKSILTSDEQNGLNYPFVQHNHILLIIKDFTSIVTQKPLKVNVFDQPIDKLKKLKKDVIKKLTKNDAKVFLEFIDELLIFFQDIVKEWPYLYKSENAIQELNSILQDIIKEMTESEKNYDLIRNLIKSLSKHTKIFKDIIAKRKQLMETKNSLITIIKSFITIMAQKPSQVKDFNEPFDKLNKLEKDLKKTEQENNDVKVVLELIEKLHHIFKGIVQQWNTLSQSSNIDTVIAKVTRILQELNREVQEKANDYSKIKTINENLSKYKEKIKSELANIDMKSPTVTKQLSYTQKQVVEFIKRFIILMGQKPSKATEFDSLLEELIDLKEDFKKEAKEIQNGKELLKLLENIIDIIKEIVSEWTTIHQASDSKVTIKRLTSILEGINRQVYESENDFQIITSANHNFPKYKETVEKLLQSLTTPPPSEEPSDTIKLTETRTKLISYIQRFISDISQKPANLKDSKEILTQIRRLKDDVKGTTLKPEIVAIYLTVLDNIFMTINDVLKHWSSIQYSSNADDLVRRITLVYEELIRDIEYTEASSSDGEELTRINQSIDRLKGELESILLNIATVSDDPSTELKPSENIKRYVEDFMTEIKNKLPNLDKIKELISSIEKLKEDVRKIQDGETEIVNYQKVIDKLIATFQDVLRQWKELHSISNVENFYDEVIRILQDILRILQSGVLTDKNFSEIVKDLTQINVIELKYTRVNPDQDSTTYSHILDDIIALAEKEKTSLNDFNPLITEIKTASEASVNTLPKKEFKEQIENLNTVFQEIVPLINVNHDPKVEESFIKKFNQLVKVNVPEIKDNPNTENAPFLKLLKRLIDETKKKVFTDGFQVFLKILEEFRYLSKVANAPLSKFQEVLHLLEILNNEISESPSNQNARIEHLTQSLYNYFKDFVTELESKQKQTEVYNSFLSEFQNIVEETLDPIALRNTLNEIKPSVQFFTEELKNLIKSSKVKDSGYKKGNDVKPSKSNSNKGRKARKG